MKVALVCIAKNEDNYINEWITYHLKLGFDKIFVYRNNWDYETTIDNVEVINFPGKCQQVNSYNQFIQSYSNEYDWAAFFDVDEFLVLKKHSNIKEFISDYNQFDSIAVNWVFFGSNNHSSVNDENYSVLNRFTKKSKSPDIHIKTICKLSKSPIFVSPHTTNMMWISPENITGRGPFNSNGSSIIAQLNHYFCKTKEEFEQKVNRGRADTNMFRSLSEFVHYDINDEDDFYAINFYNSNK